MMSIRSWTVMSLSAIVAQATKHNVFTGYDVDLAIDAKDSLYATITVTMKKGSWLGLVLGAKGMATNTDMIQIDGGAKKAYDKTSAGYQSPRTDSTDNLTTTFSETGEVITATIKRKLDTGDAKDYVFQTDKEFDLGWAINTSSSTLARKHNRAGSVKATISSGESEASASSVDVVESE